MDLNGKVALVTGASRGVGAATAVALAEAGCDVACAARSTSANPQKTAGTLDETVARVEAEGRQGFAIPTDLSREEDVVRMVSTTVERFGRLDVLINNAAVTFVGDLEIPVKRYDIVMAVNLRAPLLAIREAVPHLRAQRGGAIVNLSSVAALYPFPGLMAYGMSKVALERLTVDAARLLAGDGIAVNCFRIDLPCASEGFIANAPGADTSTWEPCEVPAEGIVWVLRKPPSYSGNLLSMYALRRDEGIMPSRATQPIEVAPPHEAATGLIDAGESMFREPYPD